MTRPPATVGTWQRTASSICWNIAGRAIWRFSFDPDTGNKPFFHPLRVGDGPDLTQAGPPDHPWHYGLWLSWKYINGANYWEESRETRRPEGTTTWTLETLDTRADGSATIGMDLVYTHPSGRVDLTERRICEISAVASDDSYRIDWISRFTAGAEGALLDRTPMPDEPNGAVGSGYAGLGLRVAPQPLCIAFVTSGDDAPKFTQGRWRPSAAAIAVNLSNERGDAGGVAIVSDPRNAGTAAPWYIASNEQMRFLCAAVLAPKPLRLAPGEKLDLHYTIALRRRGWTAEALRKLAGA